MRLAWQWQECGSPTLDPRRGQVLSVSLNRRRVGTLPRFRRMCCRDLSSRDVPTPRRPVHARCAFPHRRGGIVVGPFLARHSGGRGQRVGRDSGLRRRCRARCADSGRLVPGPTFAGASTPWEVPDPAVPAAGHQFAAPLAGRIPRYLSGTASRRPEGEPAGPRAGNTHVSGRVSVVVAEPPHRPGFWTVPSSVHRVTSSRA